jgi:protein-tyrosine phosphatase
VDAGPRLKGAPNFRELFVRRTADGRKIRRGRFFRSGALTHLNEQDRSALAALGIELVFDLRTHDEQERAPNHWPGGAQPEFWNSPGTEAHLAAPVFDWRSRLTDPDFDPAGARAWILRAYTCMPRLFAGQLSVLFDRLGAPRSPTTLVHCSAGKDRTGFICAMVLFALGAQRAVVIEDYLLTRDRMPAAGLLQAMLGREMEAISTKLRAALMVMAEVREDYLDAALHEIGREFGGVDRYLEEACGLDAERRRRLQAQMLE